MISVSFGAVPLIMFPIIFYLSFNWPNPNASTCDIGEVGNGKRLLAFLVDLYIAIIGVLPLICMPMLILEYLSTQTWVWSFERHVFRPTDIVHIPIFVFGFIGIFYYWIWHAKNKKQTFGQRLLKFSKKR